MSINHYSAKTSSSNHRTFFSTHLIPNSTANTATIWATTATGAMFCSPTAAFRFNLNNEDEEELLEEQAALNEREITNFTSTQFEQEKLFEKPLTPSDVGKLNRLVIPKQHAEKYFPLNGGGDSGEKGLLLGFEDEVGKPWRFRYSYWNSSQSYVLTKGWSRFVKEKRLDAGDIVLFGRHRKDFGRLLIGWRRRDSGGGQEGGAAQPPLGGDGGGGWSGVVYPGHPYPTQHQGSSSVLYQTDCSNAENQTISARSGNSKRLRLFGVNLEWPENESEPSTPESSAMGGTHRQPYHQY